MNNIDQLLSDYPELGGEQLKKADEETNLIVLISGRKMDGSGFYAFLAIPPSKLLDFKKAQTSGKSFSMEDYGEILATGDGKEPPLEVVKEMHEKYGLDPDFEKRAVAEFNNFKEKKKKDKFEKSLLEKIAAMKKKKPEGN